MTTGKPWSVGGEKGKSQARESKRFFFVKKKQKTFGCFGLGRLVQAG
jgi:hypothetical protein